MVTGGTCVPAWGRLKKVGARSPCLCCNGSALRASYGKLKSRIKDKFNEPPHYLKDDLI
jgi:hypothetical protein